MAAFTPSLPRLFLLQSVFVVSSVAHNVWFAAVSVLSRVVNALDQILDLAAFVSTQPHLRFKIHICDRRDVEFVSGWQQNELLVKRPVWRHRFINQAATIHFLFQYKFLLFLHHVTMLFLSVFNLKSLILYFLSVLRHFMSVPRCTFLRDKNNISRYKSLSLPLLIVKSDLFLGNFNVHFFQFFLCIFFFTTGKN